MPCLQKECSKNFNFAKRELLDLAEIDVLLNFYMGRSEPPPNQSCNNKLQGFLVKADLKVKAC